MKKSQWSQERHTFFSGRLLPPLLFPQDAPTLLGNRKGSSDCKEQLTCHSYIQYLTNITDATDITETHMQVHEQSVYFTSFHTGVRVKEWLKKQSCDHTRVLGSEVC